MWHVVIASLLTLVSSAAAQPAPGPPRVALIGGGISAASTAFHMRQTLGEAVAITVFERSAVLGGRASSVDIEGVLVELGASIAYEGNHYVAKLADAAGLERIVPATDRPDGLFAIFDGTGFVFRQSPWSLLTLIRLIWHYGFSFWGYKAQTAAMFSKFEGLYAAQDAGQRFAKPEDLLKLVDLHDLTQQNLVEWISQEMGDGYGAFAREFVAGVNAVNYDQSNVQMNALAGLVSLLPATDSRVFAIKGGNWQLAGATLEATGAHVRLNTTARTVQLQADGTFQLTYETGEGATGAEVFDAVVIAAPLEGSDLDIQDVDLPHIPARKFQTTVTTLIKGHVSPAFFALPPGPMPYDQIMVSESGTATVPFSSLSRLAPLPSNRSLYKLFSPQPLPHAWLDLAFQAGYEVAASRSWAAYPKFDPPESFAPFVLSEGLYYSGAWENAASAMEMAAIAGRNSAILAMQRLRAGAGRSEAGGCLLKMGGAGGDGVPRATVAAAA